MKVFTFASLKGGVGKSASALSVAAILSEQYRTLLIDLDPQAASSCHLNNEVTETTNKTIRQVIKGEFMPDEAIVKGQYFDFIPAEIELQIIELELLNKSNRDFLIHEIVSSLSDKYEYCVIDTPGDLGIMTRSALIAADIAVIPAHLDRWGGRAIGITMNAIDDMKDMKKYTRKNTSVIILPTFYETRRELKEMILNNLKEEYPNELYPGLIHNSTEISKAFSQEGEFLKPGSRSYEEYKDFTDYLVKKA
jgi:chromosome partitioning protein